MASGPQTKKELCGICNFLNLLINNNHTSVKSLRSELKYLRGIESSSKDSNKLRKYISRGGRFIYHGHYRKDYQGG